MLRGFVFSRFTQEMEVIRKPDAIKDARLVQVMTAFCFALNEKRSDFFGSDGIGYDSTSDMGKLI